MRPAAAIALATPACPAAPTAAIAQAVPPSSPPLPLSPPPVGTSGQRPDESVPSNESHWRSKPDSQLGCVQSS